MEKDQQTAQMAQGEDEQTEEQKSSALMASIKEFGTNSVSIQTRKTYQILTHSC